MNKPHKHAQLILQYAQDAAETETPWERWEYWNKICGCWTQCVNPYMFLLEYEYRRKSSVIVINGIEVPEPMREKPDEGTYYFVCETRGIGSIKWRDDTIDNEYFSLGICHLTREAAELHAKALLSFTKKEETK